MGAMGQAAAAARAVIPVEVWPQAPEELTAGRLTRLGEGIGKVVYASRHWVVKRERRPSEIVALIVLWKAMRKFDRMLPLGLGRKMLERPSRQIRFLRLLVQTGMLVAPKSVWWRAHVREVFRTYTSRDRKGEALARQHLAGTPLVPARITFPPARVRVGGWPGWLVVSEAVERVEMTLQDKINELARQRRFQEIEVWLDRLLACRQQGWRRGVFSLDAHLKNFGVTEDRVVLLDPGGLTNNWAEIESRLGFEDEIFRPHVQLGLEFTLRDNTEIAERFDRKWRAIVNRESVRELWPGAAV
jgi:hypothetical protein